MTNNESAEAANTKPETTTTNPDPSGQKPRTNKKGGRSKKMVTTEEKVPMTFSVSVGFSKKLKMLGGSLDESTSDYVESKLAPIVSKDLKKVLEEMK